MGTLTPAKLGAELPLWSVAPFAALLAAIAVLPLAAPHAWEKGRNRALTSLGLALVFAVGLLLFRPDEGSRALIESTEDYASFLSLLAALYVISGGIHVDVGLGATPVWNTALLGIGAILANGIGTTGASMVLIRPLIAANRLRPRKAHLVVFFIFVVSNCGGLLSPLGDPPLYLGFLKGAPFSWTLSLWKPWLLVNGLLLAVFHFVDRREFEASGVPIERASGGARVSIAGAGNLILLVGVVLAILGKGRGWGSGGRALPFGVQEGSMLLLAAIGYGSTRPATRAANGFTFAPIVEVAVLFAGIFVTMVAPLQILNSHGEELGLSRPWQYFWATGTLSSVLDNAPTYMAFAATACGRAGILAEGPKYLGDFLAGGRENAAILAAISSGAVLMGATTYIGNGPNFLVRSIAERDGVRMPSFGGYLLWSAAVLLPVLVVVTLLCFR